MQSITRQYEKIQGIGVSLRSNHFADFISTKQPVDWIEVIADQFINTHGILWEKLLKIAADYPTSLHCVSLSIAATDPINLSYLSYIKQISQSIAAVQISDHLCWSSHQAQYSHDLLPFSYNTENLRYIAGRVQQVQDAIGQTILLENLSHYVKLKNHEMTEAEFLNNLCKMTGCGILLDINNVYVSSQNLGYNPKKYLDSIDPRYVAQYHLAGHYTAKNLLIDTHGQSISSEVWQLYQYALQRMGAIASCIEWDNNIPSWKKMLKELDILKKYHQVYPNKSKKSLKTTKNKQQHQPPQALVSFQKDIWKILFSKQSIATNNNWSIHQNNIQCQHISTLKNIFPCVWQCLDNERFHAIAMAYIRTKPCYNADPSNIAKEFPAYLHQHMASAECYISELARYEWLWYMVFHDKNHNTIDTHNLEKQIKRSGDQIIIQKTSGMKIIASSFPVSMLWQACQPEYTGADIATILQQEQSHMFYYALHQRDGYVISTPLNKSLFDMLNHFTTAQTLHIWCDNLQKQANISPESIAQCYAMGLISTQEEPL